MDSKDLELMSNSEVPESIRLAIAQSLLTSQSAKSAEQLEIKKLQFEQRRFFWNTPLIAALTGLITISGTFIFDRITRTEKLNNTITLDQFKRELADSEARLKQQLEERTKKTVAEIDALAKEREFQYKIVTDELADKAKDNVQRATVLLFLARAGVLTTLNAEELRKMAEEQKNNPDQNIIPQLKLDSQEPLLNTKPVAAYDEAPWQVGLVLRNERRPFCNGVLVSEKWVMTAAHCAQALLNSKDRYSEALIGTNDYKKGGEKIEIIDYYLHPQYKNSEIAFDVAMLKLKNSPRSGRPLAMAESEAMPYPGSLVHVTGWTSVESAGDFSSIIQYIDIQVVSNEECNQPKSYDGRVTSSMFCAGNREGGVDLCLGSSGSPAKITAQGKDYVAGLLSWGEGCGRPEKYGVYTRVSTISPWAKNVMKNN